MSRSRGRTPETSLSPMWIAPASSGSSPASMRSAVDFPDPDGPTRTRSSPSAMSRLRLSTAGLSVPGYVRVASTYLTAVIRAPSLDRTHRQAADHPLLRDPSGEHHRNAGEHRGGRELREELTPGADVRRDPDRDRGPLHRVQLDGIEELVPSEDDAEESRRRDAGRGQRQDHRRELSPEPSSVDLGGLDQLAGDLDEERTQHPDGQGQVDRRVEDDQHQPRVQQIELPREYPYRQDRGHDRQEPGRDEEEEDVAPPLDRLDGQGVRRRDREREDDQRRDEHDHRRVHERLAEREQAPGALGDLAVAVEGRVEIEVGAPVCLFLGLERVEDHPEHGEEDDQRREPGQDPQRPVHPAALADGGSGVVGSHAAASPFSSRDRTLSANVAMTIDAITTTML